MRKLTIALSFLVFCLACEKEVDNKKTFLLNKVSNNHTKIGFKNIITEDVNHSIINYIYYYNGAGVAAGDVNNDSLPDLYFVSNMGDNKLYLNKGNLEFEDVSKNANITSNASWNTGATMVDINSDGLMDIYQCSVSGLLDFEGHNELFVNNGDGTFTERAQEYGLDFKGYSTQAYFFDYDKDDDLDVYIVNHAVHTTLSHGPANVRSDREPMVGDVLLKNNNGKYEDVSEQANIYGGVNGYGLSASIADFNNDGWDDIYVCNDFHEDDYYYINNQDGTFREELDGAFSTISRFSMGSDASDVNGDGFQDLITLDMLPKDERVLKETEGDESMFYMQKSLRKQGYKDQYARNMLQINGGGDYFRESALLNGIADTDWSWGPLIADFNNDGHQDLFVANGILRRPNGMDFKKYVSSAFRNRSPEDGVKWLYNSVGEMPSGKVPNEFFEGNSEKFERRTGAWIEEVPSLSNGAIYIDLDLDGDLDLVLNNLNDNANVYENTIDNTKNYISLKFDYKANNKEGIGAKAIVYSDGKQQLKQLFKSRGFLSSMDGKLHFGLNESSKVDSVHVIWPDNKLQVINNPNINQHLNIKYQPPFLEYDYSKFSEVGPYFNEIQGIEYAHTEDQYDDFVSNKIIPYKISTLGPAVAVGDIDQNGYEDVFLGNASGEKAKLFLNDGKSLKQTSIKTIEDDFLFEDNDAVFFDADNDGDLDLYVATGIHRSRLKKYEGDRLYINANGNFEKSNSQIPENNLVTSTVAAYDFDFDGDQDLFIGNLSSPSDFGPSVASYILVNDGKGQFSKNQDFSLISKVTSATWEDINNDGIKDLLISTEWDGPKVYLNKNGKLNLVEVPDKINGLWQSVEAYDVDEDGDKDILLGNWGLNTKFNPSKEKPLLMYHSDFDKNGKAETVLAYNKNGKYYPVNSKDELGGQMPVISKLFVKHSDFALKTVEEVMTKGSLGIAEKYEVHTLASGYLRNDNGEFKELVVFPQEFQMAPINNFSRVNVNDEACLLISGNTNKVNTYHGAYTSLKGIIMKDISNFDSASKYGVKPFDEQIKEVVTVEMKDKKVLMVFSNNAGLQTYTYDK